MQKTLALIVALIGVVGFLFSQNDCNPYFDFNKGKSWTIKSYSAKDKYQGKQSYEVIAVEEIDGVIVSTIKIASFDKKDKKILSNEITFECADGVVSFDMSKLIPEETMQSFKTMDMEITMDRMTIPSELYVGQKLDDGSLKLSIDGPIPIKFNVNLKDRKVESKETVVVPAGSFEAFKITYITEFTGFGSRETKNVEYIANGIGVIRSEEYNKKGDLSSYSILVSYGE